MPAIPFVSSSITTVKNALRDEFPHVGSAHLSEALAASLGFRTHAALLSALPKSESDPDYILLDDDNFDAKLTALGYLPDSGFCFGLMNSPALHNTTCKRAYEIEYKSLRHRAWRNMIVCAVNEGLRLRLFTLRPGDNRWPGWDDRNQHSCVRGAEYGFVLPNGLAAKAYVSDAGYAELAITVAALPTRGASSWLRTYGGGFHAGEAFAASWLERERGAWIQSSTSSFKCRSPLLDQLSKLDVRPAGFGDRGRVIM